MRDGSTAAIEVSGRTGEGREGYGRSETLAMAEGGQNGGAWGASRRGASFLGGGAGGGGPERANSQTLER
jgi:hypothetical protein